MPIDSWARKLLWSSAITQGVIYILRPMITYRALELNASAAAIGLIAAAYALLPVFMALTFGRWVGVLGEGRFVIFGTLGLVLSSVLMLAANSITFLTIAAAISGTAHLACMVGGQTMVSLKSDPKKYQENFGYYTFSASLGQMVGPRHIGSASEEHFLCISSSSHFLNHSTRPSGELARRWADRRSRKGGVGNSCKCGQVAQK
jgi:MFS family permease